jgi:predicted RNA-binding Zn ribbon-like protein
MRPGLQTTIPPPSTIRPHQWEFRFRSGRLCLNFVATVGDRAHAGFDRWRNEDDFARWCVESDLLPRKLAVTARQLAEARKLREAIHGIVQCALHSRTPKKNDLHAVNRHAARPSLIPQISKIGKPPTWDSPSPFDGVLSAIARDAIGLLANAQLLLRVRECADEHCSVLFIDSSRPGKRRWCAMNGCGNKEKKAAYRMRRKSPARADNSTRRDRDR